MSTNNRTPKQKSFKQTQEFAERVAKHQGWQLNWDHEFRDSLIEGLTVNFNRYGFYSCPCRDSYGDPVKDKDIQCPCVYARPDIEEYGHCYCSLYFSPEAAKLQQEPQSIPERRPQAYFPE